MNNRLLWTVAGVCLCLGLDGCGQSDADAAKGASAAKAVTALKPEDWVCYTKPDPDTGQCDSIMVRTALPGEDNEISHLAEGAEFRIEFDGNDYSLAFLSPEWPAPLLQATIRWEKAQSVPLPDDLCKEPPPVPARRKAEDTRKAPAKFTVPNPKLYAHFYSSEVLIHNSDTDYSEPERNILYIYPIENTSHTYCLIFDIVGGTGGGLHDGAVHGDS